MKMTTSNQTYDFSTNVALVTGSSSGMGAAIAIALAQNGCTQLTITGRDAKNLNAIAMKIETISGCQPLQVLGDLSEDKQLPARLVNETISKYGQLDFVVNCAGGSSIDDNFESKKLMQTYDRFMDLNLRSILAMIFYSVPHLEKTKGSVVNISGIAGTIPYLPVLSTSKAALNMLTKASAAQLAPKGIRVNAVNPGMVFTAIGRAGGNPNVFRDYEYIIKNTIPLKRIAQPVEIANLTLFLLSEDAQNITGSILTTDGGSTVKGSDPPRVGIVELFMVAKAKIRSWF